MSQGSQGTGYASPAAALTALQHSAFRSPRGANAPLCQSSFFTLGYPTQMTKAPGYISLFWRHMRGVRRFWTHSSHLRRPYVGTRGLTSAMGSTFLDRRAYGVVISLSVTNPRITEWLRPESVLRTPGICPQEEPQIKAVRLHKIQEDTLAILPLDEKSLHNRG